MLHPDWNFDEFLAFVLLYAAHADIEFSNEERKFIENKVSEEIFDNIYQEFDQLTDFQALELIMSYKDIYFTSEEDKNHLFSELHKLFHVDGDFSQLEKELMVFLDRLM
jgi:hypothetical protein